MTIYKDSWHFGAFLFGCRLVDIFLPGKYWDDRYSDRFRRGTNLCHYMRVILVYTPLILLAWAGVAAAGVGSLIVLPVYLFGMAGYGETIAVIVGAFLALVIVAFACMVITDTCHWVMGKLRGEGHTERPKAQTASASPTFFDLVAEWIVAKKKAICPTISFSEAERS